MTMTASSLIDHIVTNTPEKISVSGVIHTGLSNHSLVFAIRRSSVTKNRENIVEIRNMKNFDNQTFIEDLIHQHWENVYFFAEDPNTQSGNLEKTILRSFNRHAPLQHKRSEQKKSLGLRVNKRTY